MNNQSNIKTAAFSILGPKHMQNLDSSKIEYTGNKNSANDSSYINLQINSTASDDYSYD